MKIQDSEILRRSSLFRFVSDEHDNAGSGGGGRHGLEFRIGALTGRRRHPRGGGRSGRRGSDETVDRRAGRHLDVDPFPVARRLRELILRGVVVGRQVRIARRGRGGLRRLSGMRRMLILRECWPC